MKLLENKTHPRISVNVSGRILQMNMSAIKELGNIGIGDSVFSIIDDDVIRKTSMHKKKIELVRTRSAEYPFALIIISGRSRVKRIEIVFQRELSEAEICETKRVFSLYTEKNMPKSNTCVDMAEQISYIIEQLSTKKELLKIKARLNIKRDFYAKLGRSQAELLFVTTAMLVNEINPFAELEVLVDEGRVDISFDCEDVCFAKSMYELSSLYPQIASKLFLIQSICEDEFIEVSMTKRAHSLSVSYKIPKGSENELIVKAKAVNSSARIYAFIDTLLGKK